MSQISISPNGQAVGVAGQIFDNDPVTDIISVFSEESSAEIEFGAGVAHGTGLQGGKNVANASDVIMGVNTFDLYHSRSSSLDPSGNPVGDLGSFGLKPKAGMQVMRKGRILVTLDAGVSTINAYTDRPWLRWQTDGASNTIPGRWSNASDGHNIDLTKVGQFVSGVMTAADGVTKVAVLEVDFTSKP